MSDPGERRIEQRRNPWRDDPHHARRTNPDRRCLTQYLLNGGTVQDNPPTTTELQLTIEATEP